MLNSYLEIEKMILNQIKDIDEDIKLAKGNINFSLDVYAELYKAKSLALQALVSLKDSRDGR